ncbi:MAG: AzlC family ABC transporter permease [Desulfobacterales bacterium]|nr:AzlC family ABC transporter permease [Desulfobacterales bacterium]
MTHHQTSILNAGTEANGQALPGATGPAGLAPGFRAALPMAVGVASYGLVFGVLSQQAGMDKAAALFMSCFVFAGASQFVALDLWVAPLPVIPLILTTLVVNLRHVLMGAVLRDKLTGLTRFQTLGSLFFLVDENWAYTMAQWQQGNRNSCLLAGTGICLFLAWTISTLVGCALGSTGIDPVKWGIDFSFTAIFIFLATGMWRGIRDLVPWTVAAVTAVIVARAFPGKWYILAGCMAGSLTGVLIHDRKSA